MSRPSLWPARNKVVVIAAGVVVALSAGGAIVMATDNGATDGTARAELIGATDPPEQQRSSITPERQPPTATPEPTVTPEDSRLLPNLASQPPEEPVIEVTGDGVRQLRFASIIGNTGVGPIETRPDSSVGCPAGQRHASQIIYRDVNGDGQFDRHVDDRTTSRPAGCMLDHQGHDHWHFDGAARYVLTEPDSNEPIVSADKVSFCWRDNREVESAAADTFAQYYPEGDECGYADVQGITPGWADVYDNSLSDQYLDLPDDLPDGVYCLWNTADPYDQLVESDDTDNTAVTAVEITGTEVRTAATSEGCDSEPVVSDTTAPATPD